MLKPCVWTDTDIDAVYFKIHRATNKSCELKKTNKKKQLSIFHIKITIAWWILNVMKSIRTQTKQPVESFYPVCKRTNTRGVLLRFAASPGPRVSFGTRCMALLSISVRPWKGFLVRFRLEPLHRFQILYTCFTHNDGHPLTWARGESSRSRRSRLHLWMRARLELWMHEIYTISLHCIPFK